MPTHATRSTAATGRDAERKNVRPRLAKVTQKCWMVKKNNAQTNSACGRL